MSTYRSVNSKTDRGARERIANAALHLFSKQGFAATPVRQIADAAGVTKPMVYYYYGSKQGLRDRLLDQAMAEVRDRALGGARNPGHGREQLAWLARVYLETSPQVRALLGARLQALIAEALAVMLVAAERRGETRPVAPDLVAAALCAALGTGAVNRSDMVVDMLWSGVRRRDLT